MNYVLLFIIIIIIVISEYSNEFFFSSQSYWNKHITKTTLSSFEHLRTPYDHTYN